VQVLHENNRATFTLACLVLCTDAIQGGENLFLASAIHRDVVDHAGRPLFALMFEQVDHRLTTFIAVEYMHDEAFVMLPQFLDALGIINPILFGHSDGGSIALIHAGGSGRKDRLRDHSTTQDARWASTGYQAGDWRGSSAPRGDRAAERSRTA
jgi:pimeloyl-ACP methyl ester carboxylesterase